MPVIVKQRIIASYHATLHERWISWFLASLKVAANCEMLVVWIARHIGPFRAAEHLTHWTFISLCRLSFVFSRCLQRARLSVLYFLHAISAVFIINTQKLLRVCTYFFLCTSLRIKNFQNYLTRTVLRFFLKLVFTHECIS